MYAYEWDEQSGGYNLVMNNALQKDLRPIFFEELKFLELDKNFGWKFPKSKLPFCWAEGRRYFYRGELVAETQGGSLFTLPTLKNVVENLSLEPVDIRKMVKNNEDILKGLVQKTLKDIYNIFELYQNKVDIFYVAFSGGKDSMLMLDLIQRALPHDSFEVIFGDTSMELSDTYKTIEASKNIWADLKWHTAKAPFAAIDSWEFMGPPARKLRWCCSVHKSAPSLFKVKEILSERKNCSVEDIKNFKTLAFIGVRSSESDARSTYEKISDGAKHFAQINYYPILGWNTAELFLYHFAENLPLNNSYRKGLTRVGCKLCPMSTQLTDCLQNHFYAAEIAPFIEVVKKSIKKDFPSPSALKAYLNEGGWKKRFGGRVLRQGENKIYAVKQDNSQKYIIKRNNYSWRKWLIALGDYIEIAPNKYSVRYDGEFIIFNVENSDDAEIITINFSERNKKIIKFLTLFSSVLYKSAYCQNCRVCMLNCPHGALKITADDIIIKNCTHCHKCLEMKGRCLAAESLEIGANVNTMKKLSMDRYKTFGLRAEWLPIYFDDPKKFWIGDRLGSKMFEAFRAWGKECGLLDEKNNPSPHFEKFAKLCTGNVEDLKMWGIFWVNIAYNSPVTNIFVKTTDFNIPYENYLLLENLGSSHSERTRKNALNALKNTFRNSPIGNKLRQGICEMKGSQVISITRMVWEHPEPLVILYSLYLFAEKSDGLYNFTLTELLNDSAERVALSPKILFGLDEKILRPILQGLSTNYPQFINVEFNKEIMENVFLRKNKTSKDIIEIL